MIKHILFIVKPVCIHGWRQVHYGFTTRADRNDAAHHVRRINSFILIIPWKGPIGRFDDFKLAIVNCPNLKSMNSISFDRHESIRPVNCVCICLCLYTTNIPSSSRKASVLIVFKADTSSESVITMYRITHWTARLRFTKSVPEPLAQSISIKSLVFLILYSAYCDV